MTIKGAVSIHALTNNAPALARYICDTPRARERRTLDGLSTFTANYPSLS